MSKKNIQLGSAIEQNSISGTCLPEGGYIIRSWNISTLEGRLLTMVESWGLPEGQEKAVKDLVRQEVWKLLEPCFIIDGEDAEELRLKYEKEGKGSYGIPSR